MSSICRNGAFMAIAILLCSAVTMAQPSGAVLKDIAEQKGVYIGNIMSTAVLETPTTADNGEASSVLTKQFNAVVLENDMKMDAILPGAEPDDIHNLSIEDLSTQLNNDKIQGFINYANDPSRQMRKRGHAMIWYSQAPSWLDMNAPSWSAQQVFDFSRKYIFALGLLCKNQIDEWDVINEAINDQSAGWRPDTWYEMANDGSTTTYGTATYQNYIRKLFDWAREAQPAARLYYNDYSIENFNASPQSKNAFMIGKFSALKNEGAPIDGIGFQSHFVLEDMVQKGELNQGFIDSVQKSMGELDSAGLEVAITELDIRKCSGGSDTDQRKAFEGIVSMALSQPNCRELLIWGMRDGANWVESVQPPLFPGCSQAVIYTDEYMQKESWLGVEDGLNSLTAGTFPPAFPALS